MTNQTTNKKYHGYVTWITNKSGDYLDTEKTLNYKVNNINELLELILINGFDSYVNTIYSINDNDNYHMFNNVTDEITRLLIDMENRKLNALYNY